MSWTDQLKGDSLSWLLEEDSPGIRYLALRDLKDLSPSSRQLKSAMRSAHTQGPIATLLSRMDPEGHWAKKGPGYNPKYRSTDWTLILLAQLGARIEQDKRIATACSYLLDHALAPGGKFSVNGTPSGTVDCLQGNLCWALVELGCEDPRLEKAIEWMSRTVTGEGIAPATDSHAADRFYGYKCGPTFACGANHKLPCAWGGTKVMMAFGRWPHRRAPLVQRAIKHGMEFMLGIDPATGRYPVGNGKAPSRDWWKFGFPVFYVTDLLQVAEALVALGRGRDKRLANTIQLIRDKQDEQGRWPLEYDYAGKIEVDFGPKWQPNKWVTLRALRVLKSTA